MPCARKVTEDGVTYLTIFVKPGTGRVAVQDDRDPAFFFATLGTLPGRPTSPVRRRLPRAEAVRWLHADPLLFARANPPATIRDDVEMLRARLQSTITRGAIVGSVSSFVAALDAILARGVR